MKNNKSKYIWNLKDIYKNEQEWIADYNYCMKFINKLKKYEGTINSVNGIYNYIKDIMLSDFNVKDDKLCTYFSLLLNLNVNDKKAKKLQAKYEKYDEKLNTTSTFFEDEMNQIDIPTTVKIFSNKKLLPYKYCFREYMYKKRVIQSKETMLALIISSKGKGASYEIYNNFVMSEMKYNNIKMPNGKICEVKDELLDNVRYGKYNRKFKIDVYNAYYTTPEKYINTLASIFNSYIVDNVSELRLTNHKKFIDLALHDDDVNKKTYDMMIDIVKKMLPTFHKFIKAREKVLGYKQYFPDLEVNTSKYNKKISFDNAIEMVKNSLHILGDDYLNIFEKIINSGHLDAFPKKSKETSGFEISCDDKNVLPYILMNYTGYINEVETIAHEFGHALNDYYCKQNERNLYLYDSPSDFTQEIPSVCNEFLFLSYMIDNSKSKDEKIFYIERILNLINGTIIRQIMHSEFESYLYEVVENDEVLLADELNKKWMELNRKYFGKDVLFPDGFETRWSQIDHFFMDFYVYKYATSCTYAYILSQNIINKKKDAVKKYREFLSTGDIESPRKILKKVGIDIEDKKIYEEMLQYYKKLVNVYIELSN